MFRRIVIVLGVAFAVFLATPAPSQAFCGSLCSPEGLAVTSLLAGGTEAAAVTTTGAAVAAAEVATAPIAGQVLGIAVTGGVAVAAGALSVLAGGLPDWIWKPGSTVTAMPTGDTLSTIDYALGSGYPPGYNLPNITYAPNPNQVTQGTLNGTFTPKYFPSPYDGWQEMSVYCRFTVNAAQTAAQIVAQHVGGGYSSQWFGSKYTEGSVSYGYTNGSYVWTNHTIYCPANSTPDFLNLWWKRYGYNYGPLVYKLGGGTVNGTPGSAAAGRTIQQTVTCKKKDGSLYTKTATLNAEATITDTSLFMIAGLMCEVGDWSESSSVVLKTPGKPDYPIQTAAPTYKPKWQAIPDPVKATALDPTNTVTLTDPQPTTGNPPIVEVTSVPVDSSTPDPGTDGSSSFCGLTFGDLLTGFVVFKATGCALQWAFVPSTGVVATEVAALQASWASSAVGTFTTTATGVVGSVAGIFTVADVCGGVPVSFDLEGVEFSGTFLDSCNQPMKTIADTTRLILTVVVVLFGALLILNTILLAFGLPRFMDRGGSDGD